VVGWCSSWVRPELLPHYSTTQLLNYFTRGAHPTYSTTRPAPLAVVHGDGAFEHIGVVAVVGAGGFGAGNAEQGAQLGEEHRVVGPLGGAGGLPAGDEIRNGFLIGVGFVWQAAAPLAGL
jgi:hypothetical protein